jgi:hypothetical protein
MKLARIIPENTKLDFDLEGSVLAAVEDPTKSLYFPDVLDGAHQISLFLEGTLSTNGISSKVYKNKDKDGNEKENTVYTFGLKLSQDDRTKINAIYDHLLGGLDFEGFTKKDIFRNDILYLKLRVDDGKFTCNSNVSLNPKSLNKAAIRRGQSLEAFVSFGAFINLQEKQCGPVFKVEELDFIKPKKD